MEKINRLGWVEGFSFISYGVKVGLRASKPGFVDLVADLLPPGFKLTDDPLVHVLYSFVLGGNEPRRNVRLLNMVYADARRVARERELKSALDLFEADLRLRIAYKARRRTFVHAGAVGWKGKAIVIPGRTFTGKTTLVAALIKLGAEYYSDEYAVLDLQGRVHPFPRPLSVRIGTALKGTPRPVEEFGAVAATKPLPIGLVLDTRFCDGARWRPRKISRGAAALALLNNTVSARSRPARNMPVLRKAVSNAVALRGVRGDAETIARSILSALDIGMNES
jgi:hypothetical protein